MVVFHPKTGAVIMAVWLRHEAATLKRYATKLATVIAAAQTAGVITSAEASQVNAFLAQVDTLLIIMEKVATFATS
jgi:hypothetical protein